MKRPETSIRLDPKLWPKAMEVQKQRLTQDPWFDVLQSTLSEMEGKISSLSVWEILNVPGSQRTQDQSRRVSEAMGKLGWRRANSGRTIKMDGKLVMGFVRGTPPWRPIKVRRDMFNEVGPRALRRKGALRYVERRRRDVGPVGLADSGLAPPPYTPLLSSP